MGVTCKSILCTAALVVAVLIPACAELEPPRRPPADPRESQAQTPPAPEVLAPQDDGAFLSEVEVEAEPEPRDLGEPVRGTGRFLNRVPRRAVVTAGPEGDITLNFVNAEIVEVVRAVMGDILGLNFVVDPAVKGMVTLQTSRPVAREAVLPALESALSVAGMAIVPGPDLYRVVPRERASGQGAPTTISGEGPPLRAGFAIRIVPLQYVSAEEMAKILEPIAFKGTIIRVDPVRNLVILAAPSPELRTLEDMVSVFDVDWLAGLSLALIPLEFVEPEVLVEELRQIVGEDPTGKMGGVLRFLPVNRLHAVLVISTQPAYLDRARDMVARLDQSGDGTERQLFVYRVQNSDASAMADTLGRLFGAGGGAGINLRDALAPQLSPAEVRVRQGAQVPGSMADQARTTGERPAAGTGPGGPGAEARPRYEPPPAERPTGPAPAFTLEGAEQIRVVADRANNAILVWATPNDYRMMRSVLQKLDIVPLQVLIEATIAEVTLNDNLRYGTQWFFRSSEASAFLTRAGSVSLTDPAFAALSGFTFFINGVDVKVIIDALESVSDLNVISSPQLMVLDNQTAYLQVGDQVPVLIQQAQSVIDPDAPIVNSIEYRDTGIILNVTPRVNEGGLVSLTIDQEASLVADTTTTQGIQSPTFRQRRITSTVAVQSGETVVLGGLIQESRDRIESGIPGLRDIPGLGFFFGAKENDAARTELLVMITPLVVRNQQDIRRITQEMRQRLRALEPLDRKIQ